MNVQSYMAARARLLYDGQETLAGALLAKPDDDDVVAAVEDAFSTYYDNKTMAPVDVIELKISACVDAGEDLPISNPESYGVAEWFMQSADIATIPDPMPRTMVLYVAKALVDVGKDDNMTDALNAILAAKQFF